MPHMTRRRFLDEVITDDVICGHLVRAARGEGRWVPASGGGQQFACDTGNSLGGCAWCAYAWPGGNPLNADR